MKPARKLCSLGSHRVLEPAGVLPQVARKLDATPVAHANEILCDVVGQVVRERRVQARLEEHGGSADPDAARGHIDPVDRIDAYRRQR